MIGRRNFLKRCVGALAACVVGGATAAISSTVKGKEEKHTIPKLTEKFISIMKTGMRRNAKKTLTDLFKGKIPNKVIVGEPSYVFYNEATERWGIWNEDVLLQDINNWVKIDEKTREDIYINNIQHINISNNFNKEELFELGRKGPYHRYVNFPIEVKVTPTWKPDCGGAMQYLLDNTKDARWDIISKAMKTLEEGFKS
jgi:hypothetical protein